MKKYKVRVYATMEFEIYSEDKYSVNHDASYYVDDNRDLFDWNFDGDFEEIN